uniref:Copia protein n=1 Tax=Cajanus cajan TaxID=3821 RepID=A0A151TPN8_CAJCA|nr:hypothetical protein KK1_022684 [Cajanus cajan]
MNVAPDGNINHFKAWFVAKGYTQIYGLDYGDTFSPISKITFVCLFLVMPTPRFTTSDKSHLVCHLRCSIYGLKQSPLVYVDDIAITGDDSNGICRLKSHLIEIDCHFVREKVVSGEIKIEFVHSSDRLAYVFIKSLKGPQVDYICNKLGAYHIYTPALRGSIKILWRFIRANHILSYHIISYHVISILTFYYK